MCAIDVNWIFFVFSNCSQTFWEHHVRRCAVHRPHDAASLHGPQFVRNLQGDPGHRTECRLHRGRSSSARHHRRHQQQRHGGGGRVAQFNSRSLHWTHGRRLIDWLIDYIDCDNKFHLSCISYWWYEWEDVSKTQTTDCYNGLLLIFPSRIGKSKRMRFSFTIAMNCEERKIQEI